MVRVILFLLAIAALATGLSWLADRPGDLVLNWEGYEVQTTVFRAVVIFSAILASPALLSLKPSPAAPAPEAEVSPAGV